MQHQWPFRPLLEGAQRELPSIRDEFLQGWVAKRALQDALFESRLDNLFPRGGLPVPKSIKGCVCHVAAHGTGSEEVVVGGTKIKHPKTEGFLRCNLDAEFLLGDF